MIVCLESGRSEFSFMATGRRDGRTDGKIMTSSCCLCKVSSFALGEIQLLWVKNNLHSSCEQERQRRRLHFLSWFRSVPVGLRPSGPGVPVLASVHCNLPLQSAEQRFQRFTASKYIRAMFQTQTLGKTEIN